MGNIYLSKKLQYFFAKFMSSFAQNSYENNSYIAYVSVYSAIDISLFSCLRNNWQDEEK